MNDLLHVVCPICLATNRLPASRLGQKPKCGQCHQALFNAHPLELTVASFDKHVNRNDIPLLVDFWADWCGPCKMMAPAFMQAAQHLEPSFRLAKVNTEAQPQLSAEYNIRSIPTLILFKNGKELARQAGAMQAQDIFDWANSKV